MPTFQMRQEHRVARHQNRRYARRLRVLASDKTKFKGKAFTRQVHK